MVGIFCFPPTFQGSSPTPSTGQLLAVTWSDNITRLIGADSNKVIHQIHASSQKKDQDTRVTCLGWGVNFTDPKGVKTQIESSPNSSLDEFLSQAVPPSTPGFIADLPAELALIDVDVTLPKLSVLPSGGKEYVYSTIQCRERS
jgi:anaphase-promoting complex subunit 4